MKSLIQNIHWFLIGYAVFNFYTLYTEKEEQVVSINDRTEVQQITKQRHEKSKKEIENFYANIEIEKSRIERVAIEIEKMQQLLPGEISDNANISAIKQMASDLNIRDISIAPETEVEKEFFFARRYRIKAKATYLQFMILLEKVSEFQRILNVSESFFNKTDDPQKGKFQVINGNIVLEAYRHNPNFKEARAP